jgi:hypothetical protein
VDQPPAEKHRRSGERHRGLQPAEGADDQDLNSDPAHQQDAGHHRRRSGQGVADRCQVRGRRHRQADNGREREPAEQRAMEGKSRGDGRAHVHDACRQCGTAGQSADGEEPGGQREPWMGRLHVPTIDPVAAR